MSMGINASYADYSELLKNYRAFTIPTVSVEDVQKQDLERQAEQQAMGIPAYETSPVSASEPSVRKQDARLEDISLTFNSQDDFGYLGQDSDIHSLDVEKAISDMEKDRMLKQYQYFVGSSVNLYEQHQTADGIVIPKL